ncbi:hypothetical protein N0V87_009435 [Didymella glomerata]|uniref:5'-3' DNA helicase ZGRF1-like N-terminal domain-containing protein n=1 Tax=Didymella glomerata TaxID=749621 RepID=A0A9W8WR56_9PLEO|nr:hypothetical protein N0V87_009435 [Didymella glomerata]
MTAPLRSTPHSQLPASQTAPVAEFRCLYTPDIRKKQKKWQDGFLKFHTFNNRVMVYDQARNFLGDTYYKDSNELHEGDELTLDKGVMVEVADAMGVTQTDLAPLFEKKPKEGPPPTAPPRRFQPPSQVARPHVAPSSNTARANAQQLRHKSLSTLLGTPKGPIGKSVPIKSPYEARQEKEREHENDFVVDRAAKRQKTAHSSTSSATLRLSSPAAEESPAPRKNLPLWAKTSDAKPARKPARPIPPETPVITLDELDAIAHVSSDASLPSTPPRVTTTARPVVTPAPPIRPAAVEKPVLQTPKIPRGKVPVPSVKALETPKAPAPASSPPVSASNRVTNVDFAIQSTPAKEPLRRPPKQPSPPRPVETPASPPRNPKAKSLRLSKGVKRGTLMMCQPPPPPRSTEISEARAVVEETTAKNARQDTSQIVRTARAVSQTSGDVIAPKTKRKPAADDGRVAKSAKARHTSLKEPMSVLDEDQEVMHGLMDQALLVSRTPPPADEPILVPDSPEPVLPKPKAKRTARPIHKTTPPRTKEADSAKPISPPDELPATTEPTKKPAQNPRPIRKPSPPAAGIIKAAQVEARAASPALSAVSESRSRTTSLSPRKLAALSTGGFRRKGKRATPQPTPAPEVATVASCNETVALPPHPLRANKKGPVMTTTELAAMLQKPRKRPKVPADPIEEGDDVAGTSPNRKFRRVRSENDAPIPSTSEDWEKRNLPNTNISATISAATDSVPAAASTVEARETPAVAAMKKSGLAALIKRTDPRKKFVRTQSLTVETTIPPPAEIESPMVSPTVDKDIGPWSTEAFDLFDWRPPKRDETEN